VYRLTCTAVMIAALAGPARAFPTGDQFDADALASDGAGGIPFDGAPRWAGHTCASCHSNAPGRISLALEADQPALFTIGWQPMQQYHLRVVLQHEWAGVQYAADASNCGPTVTPYVPCDQNGFALELDDTKAHPVGTLAAFVNGACVPVGTVPIGAPVRVLNDGTAITHEGIPYALTAWDLCWTAPAAGAGTITAYLAVVDGNGGDGTIDFPADPTGDDVATGVVPIAEAGAIAPPAQTGGCDATGSAAGLWLVVAALGAITRITRFRRRAIAALLTIVSLGGCVHVRPYQRGTLARKDMTFDPDPGESQLDLHMQESREGSAGGYGSSGGGCGCN